MVYPCFPLVAVQGMTPYGENIVNKPTTVLCLIIAALVISLWVCISMLMQTKNELTETQSELETRREVWWKLRSLSSNYHQKLMLSIPDLYDYNKVSQKPIVVRNDDWEGFRYEFSADGKSAHFFRLDKECKWSLKPKSEE